MKRIETVANEILNKKQNRNDIHAHTRHAYTLARTSKICVHTEEFTMVNYLNLCINSNQRQLILTPKRFTATTPRCLCVCVRVSIRSVGRLNTILFSLPVLWNKIYDSFIAFYSAINNVRFTSILNSEILLFFRNKIINESTTKRTDYSFCKLL